MTEGRCDRLRIRRRKRCPALFKVRDPSCVETTFRRDVGILILRLSAFVAPLRQKIEMCNAGNARVFGVRDNATRFGPPVRQLPCVFHLNGETRHGSLDRHDGMTRLDWADVKMVCNTEQR